MKQRVRPAAAPASWISQTMSETIILVDLNPKEVPTHISVEWLMNLDVFASEITMSGGTAVTLKATQVNNALPSSPTRTKLSSVILPVCATNQAPPDFVKSITSPADPTFNLQSPPSLRTHRGCHVSHNPKPASFTPGTHP
jgi:hypothetical protein